MKTIFSAVLFLQVSMFLLAAPSLSDERREFISKTMNREIQQLLRNSDKEIIAEEPFSSKNNSTVDYMIGFYDTDQGLLVTLQAMEQRLDEYGRAIPDVYSSELVAVVFVDQSLLWYKSETAKSALKTKMARLMGKQFT
ncbi:MAG: hypothetical protein ACTHMB_14855 [Candidatus Binatia bacterium]